MATTKAQQDELLYQLISHGDMFGICAPGECVHGVRVHAICEDSVPSVTMTTATTVVATMIIVVLGPWQLIQRHSNNHPPKTVLPAATAPTNVTVVVFSSIVPPGSAMMGPELQRLFRHKQRHCVPPDNHVVIVVIVAINNYNVHRMLAATTTVQQRQYPSSACRRNDASSHCASLGRSPLFDRRCFLLSASCYDDNDTVSLLDPCCRTHHTCSCRDDNHRCPPLALQSLPTLLSQLSVFSLFMTLPSSPNPSGAHRLLILLACCVPQPLLHSNLPLLLSFERHSSEIETSTTPSALEGTSQHPHSLPNTPCIASLCAYHLKVALHFNLLLKFLIGEEERGKMNTSLVLIAGVIRGHLCLSLNAPILRCQLNQACPARNPYHTILDQLGC